MKSTHELPILFLQLPSICNYLRATSKAPNLKTLLEDIKELDPRGLLENKEFWRRRRGRKGQGYG